MTHHIAAALSRLKHVANVRVVSDDGWSDATDVFNARRHKVEALLAADAATNPEPVDEDSAHAYLAGAITATLMTMLGRPFGVHSIKFDDRSEWFIQEQFREAA